MRLFTASFTCTDVFVLLRGKFACICIDLCITAYFCCPLHFDGSQHAGVRNCFEYASQAASGWSMILKCACDSDRNEFSYPTQADGKDFQNEHTLLLVMNLVVLLEYSL